MTFQNARDQDESEAYESRKPSRGPGGSKAGRRKKAGDGQDDDGSGAAAQSRMLKTEEIREICDKHQLTRMEVYNIRSQFAGMCLMSKEDE